MKQITHQQAMEAFEAQGVSSHRHYAVKCPRCGTVQSMASMVRSGADPDTVERYFAFSCEGRFNDAGEWPNDPGKQAKRLKRGCNWTLGGLFRIHTVELISDDGTSMPMFEIADSTEAQALEQTESGYR